MFPYWNEFVTQDHVSMISAVFCLFLLGLYFLFVVYFAFIKSDQMALKNRQEREEVILRKIDNVKE